MKYTNGEILVCSTTWSGSSHFDISVGEQYEIIDSISSSSTPNFTRHALAVKSLKTNNIHYWVDSKCFIPLSVYREFQLRKILD